MWSWGKVEGGTGFGAVGVTGRNTNQLGRVGRFEGGDGWVGRLALSCVFEEGADRTASMA